jgi:hypothetical protein
MIPDFGGYTGNLKQGIHPATWAEVEERLGFSERRLELLEGLLAACRELKAGGVQTLYLDGSFVTKKASPKDWDACFSMKGVDPDKVDSVLFDMRNERAAMKAKYRGEVFLADESATPFGEPYLSFFQKDRNKRTKGIVALDLGKLP